MSQGAMFRHFETRRDLIVAAADAIAQLHLEALDRAAPHLRPADAEPHATVSPLVYARIVEVIRQLCRSPTHAAWREIMIAARTDTELRVAARAGLQRFEAALIEHAGDFLGVDATAAERASTVILSIMHMFDSEAVTVVVYDNPRLEAERMRWAAQMLAREVEAARQPAKRQSA